MDTTAAWEHRDKVAWGAAGSVAIAIFLLTFFTFSQWIEFAPGSTRVSTRGQADPNTPGGTRTVTTRDYKPGDVYYNWTSISTFPTTIPIAGAIALLALAGWTAATSANRRKYDQARLKRASNYAFAAVGIGIVGGIYFLFSMWWEDYGEYWLDAGFYGLIFGGGTAAVLLRMLASAPRPEPEPVQPA